MGTSNTVFKVAGVVTGLLGGFLTGLWEIFLSPAYIGATLVPLSPVLAAITNFALIWYVRRLTGSTALSLLPGVVWFATMLVGTSGGPGGDVLLPGDAAGRMGLIAILVGAAVWAIMAYRQVLNRAAPAGFSGPGPRRGTAPSGQAAPARSAPTPPGGEAAESSEVTESSGASEGAGAAEVKPARAGQQKSAGSRPKSSNRRPSGSSKSPRPGGRR
ncbi:hypothetical protein [Rugosimonospora africana]|uniref:Uncharacterized protein n=1 Tax=Rugosimonospora africana TaxID=556532 RepID=A0A8J3QLC1_9ACTN|nr:hypothetical protein [Rugosimonospora africana]GIH12706.1 hypothetical protein Raf01_08780 [Rugosimonospora africana]